MLYVHAFARVCLCVHMNVHVFQLYVRVHIQVPDPTGPTAKAAKSRTCFVLAVCQVLRANLRPSLARSVARRSARLARRWLSHEELLHLPCNDC